MPDWFRGKAFPIDQDGNKEALGKFFQGTYVVLYCIYQVLSGSANAT